MEIKVGGEGAIAASPEEIWNVIFEPVFMSRVIPGCKDIAQPAEDEYKIRMVLGIPAVQGHYSGTLRILQKNPYDSIKGSIEGLGGWGKSTEPGKCNFKKKVYTVNVDISGPMASMVGGFMEQVADSLVKHGLDSFNTAITGTRDSIVAGTPLKINPLPKPSLIKMIFRSVWQVLFNRIRN